MKPKSLWSLAAVALAALALGDGLRAAPPALTTITIPNMHCGGCARKVAEKVAAVPGVGAIHPDLKTKTLAVTPKAGQAPSPRALWEAVEKADKTPTRLEGPSGTFTAKPQS